MMLLFAMQHAQDACAIVRSAQSIDLRRGCVAWWSAPFVFVPSVCNAAQSDPERNTSEGQLASSACVCTMHLDRFTRHPWSFTYTLLSVDHARRDIIMLDNVLKKLSCMKHFQKSRKK
jgi:hypothetical protein